MLETKRKEGSVERLRKEHVVLLPALPEPSLVAWPSPSAQPAVEAPNAKALAGSNTLGRSRHPLPAQLIPHHATVSLLLLEARTFSPRWDCALPGAPTASPSPFCRCFDCT